MLVNKDKHGQKQKPRQNNEVKLRKLNSKETMYDGIITVFCKRIYGDEEVDKSV